MTEIMADVFRPVAIGGDDLIERRSALSPRVLLWCSLYIQTGLHVLQLQANTSMVIKLCSHKSHVPWGVGEG